MMNTQLIQIPVNLEGKIIVDTFGRANKKVIADVLGKICMNNPRLNDVLDYVDAIYIVRKEDTYKSLVNEALGDLSKYHGFFELYPFEKPKGYSVHGLTFDKTIVINLHQLFQSADEYTRYLSSDEHTQRRDFRYYAKDCHYRNFNEIISNKHQAVNFLFWNALFQQIRIVQQSIQLVDMKEFGYDECHCASVNDTVGFAKYMYKNIVNNEKAID